MIGGSLAIHEDSAHCQPSRSHRRLIDVANPGQVRTMVAHVCHLHRQLRRESMLHAEGPVPHVRCGQVAVDCHDWARAVEAINRAAAVNRSRHPRDQVREDRDVSGCDPAPAERFPPRQWVRRSERSRAESVVKGDKRLPIHGFVNESAPAPQHGPSIAPGVPREAARGAEVLVIGIVEAADTVHRTCTNPTLGSKFPSRLFASWGTELYS